MTRRSTADVGSLAPFPFAKLGTKDMKYSNPSVKISCYSCFFFIFFFLVVFFPGFLFLIIFYFFVFDGVF